jgi:multisubunit Na+/H+ antiporter MnhC subunit
MIDLMLCGAIFILGIFSVAAKKDMLKIIIGFILCEYAVATIVLIAGTRTAVRMPAGELASMILICGFASSVMLAAIIIRVHTRFGSMDISKIRKLRG